MVVKIKSQNYCAVILSVPIALVKITHQTCIWFTFFAKGCEPEHRLFIWVNRAVEFWVHVATFIVLAETPFWWKQNATTTELLLVVPPHCMKLDGLDLCCNYFLEVKGYLKKKKKRKCWVENWSLKLNSFVLENWFAVVDKMLIFLGSFKN